MADKNITNSGEGLSKWQIAAAVGAAGAIGIAGLIYLKSRKSAGTGSDADKAEKGSSKVTKSDKPEPELSPLEKAQAAKNKGNKYFKAGRYEQAIKCYTEALLICPAQHASDIATFYQNRAAAHEQLKSYAEVIADCSSALENNRKYTKALYRRGKAYEAIGELTKSLEDITAVCILEGFQNQQSLLMADRVLKELGKSKAKEAYKKREPIEPSSQFIRTYFSAFANDPILMDFPAEDDENEKHQGEIPEKERIEDMEKENADGDGPDKSSPFKTAVKCLREKQYENVVKYCSSEINLPESSHLAEALLVRATFYLLRGEGIKSMEDLDRLMNIADVRKELRSNALIKRGSLKMQNGNQTDALDDFATAVREDSENSDIYHHRGQLNLLIDRVEDAVKDFERSVTLSPQFAIAHVQKCYTEYRLAFARRSPMQLQSAMKTFEDTLEKFSDCAEGFALFGQALGDQQEFERADKNFMKALETEPDSGNIYVHRGLLRLQWKQDIDEAAKLMNKALEVDPKCEFAYETLGTIEIQRGNVDAAIGLFTKAINLAKTEVEMAHLYSLLDAAVAQSHVAKNLGIQVPGMASM